MTAGKVADLALETGRSAGYTILDLDGTLHPGTMGISFLRELVAAGSCDRVAGDRLLSRLGELTPDDLYTPTMMERTYQEFATVLGGVPVTRAEHAAKRVWRRERVHLFPFVHPLLRLLRQHHSHVLLISGSPEAIVSAVAADLGIRSSHGAVFGIENGAYNGMLVDAPVLNEGKVRWLDALIADHGHVRPTTLAVGNSIVDQTVLAAVDHPIAFEPDPELLTVATSQGWPVARRDSLIEHVSTALAWNLQERAS